MSDFVRVSKRSRMSTATRFCSSEYRLRLLCGGMSPPFSRYSSYQAYKVARAGYPSYLMTDAGLMSYLTNSSTALTFSSLEYIRVSKSHRTGTGFRQRPQFHVITKSVTILYFRFRKPLIHYQSKPLICCLFLLKQ